MNNSQQVLGTESIGKLLLKYSVPAIIGMMVNALYNVVDRMFIGNIPGVGSTSNYRPWCNNAYNDNNISIWYA